MSDALSGALSSPFSVLLQILIALLAGVVANEIVFHILKRAGNRWRDPLTRLIVRRCWWPSRVSAAAVAGTLAAPVIRMPSAWNGIVLHLLTLALIASAAWWFIAVTLLIEDVTMAHYPMDVRDNLKARRVRTKITVIRRVTVLVISTLAFATALTTFSDARTLGASLLASAGIAGLVIGIAARPTVSSVIAGLQIFFSEPVRIDDVVVVDGQWGRVEEITLTYIVVRIWDDRRLVIPILYFLDRPFENWTRNSAHLLAAVTISVDHMVVVDRVRAELRCILDASELWDRRFWNLQVTDVGQTAVELRALMTAPDADAAWDLRCEVREKLLAYLKQQPDSLPGMRMRIVNVRER